jgi:hypothetical protein
MNNICSSALNGKLTTDHDQRIRFSRKEENQRHSVRTNYDRTQGKSVLEARTTSSSELSMKRRSMFQRRKKRYTAGSVDQNMS